MTWFLIVIMLHSEESIGARATVVAQYPNREVCQQDIATMDTTGHSNGFTIECVGVKPARAKGQ
jgi:hypothetical protein